MSCRLRGGCERLHTRRYCGVDVTLVILSFCCHCRLAQETGIGTVQEESAQTENTPVPPMIDVILILWKTSACQPIDQTGRSALLPGPVRFLRFVPNVQQ
jgi:hypothetical protein